jgi:putative ABC transport system ATP-binding protein
VVMVTHEPDIARRSRRIIWFLDGQVLQAYLTPAEVSQIAAS